MKRKPPLANGAGGELEQLAKGVARKIERRRRARLRRAGVLPPAAFDTRHERLATFSVVYQLRLVRCGKSDCGRCRGGGAGHGPYWYAYWTEFGRTRDAYIGKSWKSLTEVFEARASRKESKNNVSNERRSKSKGTRRGNRSASAAGKTKKRGRARRAQH